MRINDHTFPPPIPRDAAGKTITSPTSAAATAANLAQQLCQQVRGREGEEDLKHLLHRHRHEEEEQREDLVDPELLRKLIGKNIEAESNMLSNANAGGERLETIC